MVTLALRKSSCLQFEGETSLRKKVLLLLTLTLAFRLSWLKLINLVVRSLHSEAMGITLRRDAKSLGFVYHSESVLGLLYFQRILGARLQGFASELIITASYHLASKWRT